MNGLLTCIFLVCTVHAATSTPQKLVALTFDDGPYGTSTEQILAILKREQVPATFFLMGENVLKYPELTREIVADGHEIGNHTFSHRDLKTLKLTSALDDIERGEAAIASTTGQRPKLFRPPYGSISGLLIPRVEKRGYKLIFWNVDPDDWDIRTSSMEIEKWIRTHEKPKMVIDFHDGRDTHINYPRDNTVGALPFVIEDLKKDGYTFVTISKLGPFKR